MSQNDFTLYIDSNFWSPYALSAYVALTEKAVPFEIKKIDMFAQQTQSPEYQKVSLTRRVPTLSHQGFLLSESSAIDEYLEDLLPAPQHARLYPPDLRDRALARQVQAWVRSDLMAIREERSTATVFDQPSNTPLSEAGRRAADVLLNAVEKLLPAGAQHLFGQWCIADTDLAMMLMRLVRSGDAMPERIKTYALAQWARPSVAQWVSQATSSHRA